MRKLCRIELFVKLEIIYSLTILSFILYSAFPVLRYVFYPLLILLTTYFVILIINDWNLSIFIQALWPLKDLLIIAVIFVIASAPYDYFRITYKEIIKLSEVFLLSLVFTLNYNRFKSNNIFFKLIQYFYFITFFFGVIYIVIFILTAINANFEFLKLFPSRYSIIAIHSDRNFYALTFILPIIIYLTQKNNRSYFKYKPLQITALLVYIINVVLTFSRRGLFIIFIIGIIYVIIEIFNLKNISRKRVIINGTLLTIFTFILIQIFLSKDQIIKNTNTRTVLTSSIYKVYSIFEPKINYKYIYNRLWQKYPPKHNRNLIYNGDFSDNLNYWKKTLKENDTSRVELFNENGVKFVRISKFGERGWYPLDYNGRQILYYKDVNYTYSFKYRLIKGKGLPFRVGWWVLDSGKHPGEILPDTIHLEDDWIGASVSYKFKENHFSAFPDGITVFPGTIIDVREFSIIMESRHDAIRFSDQLIPKYSDVNFDFAAPRTNRFIYFKELFTNSPTLKKIFGSGFEYMYNFYKIFVNSKLSFVEIKRQNLVDYPHNPILSSFLYSGILGGFFYIYFLIMSFYYYIKNRKTLEVFFYMYLVTFFFMMFSANSHFSVPIFTFLSVLPFIENYKRKEVQLQSNAK